MTRFLPPATKLGQGYVFTPVCDSVHRGVPGPGGSVCSGGCLVRRGVCSWGVCLVRGGGVPGLGGLVPGGCLGPGGGSGPGGCLVKTSRDGHCCGRYASYWNAFLLQGKLHRSKLSCSGVCFLNTTIFYRFLIAQVSC